MTNRSEVAVWCAVVMILMSSLFFVPAANAARDQASIVASEISAFSNLLSLRPTTAIDLSKVSDAYCFNVELEDGGKMTHYAIDPSSTREDVVDFLNAEPFIKAGLKLNKLERFSGALGSMIPKKWYYLPAGAYEPHHGVRFPFPVIMRAVNID